jgi:hypothetical protein
MIQQKVERISIAFLQKESRGLVPASKDQILCRAKNRRSAIESSLSSVTPNAGLIAFGMYNTIPNG